MIKKIILVLMLLLTLSACIEKEDPRLNRPTFIEYKDGYIRFNEIEEAEQYVLLINFDEVIIDETEYFFITEGEFIVSVKSRAAGYKDSFYSQSITFTISYQAPSNVYLDGYKLKWTDMNALSYEVAVSGSTFSYVLNAYSNQVVVNPYLSDLTVKIKAIYPYSESEFTNEYYFPKDESIAKESNFNYSINSNFDLVIIGVIQDSYINSIKYNDKDIDQNIVYFENGVLYLKSDYIKQFNEGMHELLLSTSRGNYLIKLNVIDTINPYLVSYLENYISYIYTFELFNGDILGINGSGITVDDYHINGSRLLIDYDFIYSKFENDENLESFSLSYSIEIGDDLFIGYFSILRP
ncbi:MAG: hypothetical protein CVV57_05400 [Tenericutes bacterium HGW-Tenericutes-2]|nr:MAG: hypothetical protein CVV57_05400 [Tenericutes bacterium HGW-Tenericutes-2]